MRSNDHDVWSQGASTDLHTLWDDVLPLRPAATTRVPVSLEATAAPPLVWAEESFALTRSAVYTVPPGATLDDTYLTRAEPIVAERLALASARLAHVLNRALVGEPPPWPDPLGGQTYSRDSSLLSGPLGRTGLVALLLLLTTGITGWWWRRGHGPAWQAAAALARIRGPALLSLVAILLTIAVDVVSPLAMKFGLDTVIPDPTPAHLSALAVLLVGAVLLAIGGWLLAAHAQSHLAARFQLQLREQMLGRLQGASLHAVRAHGVSDLLARFQTDLQQFDAFVLRELPKLVRSTLQAVALLLVMFSIEWLLSLGTVLLMPLVMWLPRRMAARARRARGARQDAEARASEVVHEVVDSLPVLRASGLEAHWQHRFQSRSAQIHEASLRQGWLSVMIPGVGFTTGQALTVVVLLGATLLAAAGHLSTGDLTALFTALVFFASAASRLTTSLPGAVHALNAWERIGTVLALPQVPPAHTDLPPPRGPIQLQQGSSATKAAATTSPVSTSPSHPARPPPWSVRVVRARAPCCGSS